MGVDTFTLLFFGFFAALLGVSLPGLLNMTAVKIANQQGRKSVTLYISGALCVILLQTYVAVFFARLIESSPFITEILQEIGLFIFGALTIYFLGFAKRKEKNKHSKSLVYQQKPFVYGFLLASINLFSIPYYVFLSITLLSYNYAMEEKLNNLFFSVGVTLGSATMFYLYILLFKKSSEEDTFVMRNINYIIGTITGIISLITIFKLLK